jgi:hypothetical protein
MSKINEKFGNTRAGQGLFNGLKRVMNYMDFPAAIEDWSRSTMFVNGLRQGYSPKKAAELVDKALFDYMGGLSEIETRVARRIIPFYSFQRFAVPMIAESFVKTPGRIANHAKVAKALLESYSRYDGEEPLTAQERKAVPGWLMEQPHAARGFDDEMRRTFKVFNNFSPLDVFSFIEGDEHSRGADGKINWRKTFTNAFLAQLTPIFKVPLEIGIGRDFFTGNILEASRPKKLGPVDTDELLGNVMGAILATVGTGLGGSGTRLAGGNLVTDFITKLTPEAGKEWLKDKMGLEQGVDPRTGETVTYISPYRMHILASVLPGLNDAIKTARTDMTPLEQTQRFLFGVPTHKINLEEQQIFRQQRIKRHLGELKGNVKRAQLEQRFDDMKRAQLELKKFMDWAKEDWEIDNGERDGTVTDPNRYRSAFDGFSEE